MATSLRFPLCFFTALGLKLVLSCRGNCCLISTLHPGKCFGGLLRDMRMLVQQDWRIYGLVPLACKFCFGSEGMIMTSLKHGRVQCVCSISWMRMYQGKTCGPCYYVSPGFPVIMI